MHRLLEKGGDDIAVKAIPHAHHLWSAYDTLQVLKEATCALGHRPCCLILATQQKEQELKLLRGLKSA